MNLKWLTVPFSNATRKIEVPHLWEVRWTSLDTSWHVEYPNKRPEIEAFTSKDEAIKFRDSLISALKLLRQTGKIVDEVTMRQAK